MFYYLYYNTLRVFYSLYSSDIIDRKEMIESLIAEAVSEGDRDD